MKTRSLTKTLIVGVLLAELLCAIVLSALALFHEMHGRERAFDVMLHGRADSVLGAIQDAEDREDNVIVDQTELPLPRGDAYEVIWPSGLVVGRSPGLSPEMINAFSQMNADRSTNFTVSGRRYRALRQPGMRVVDREEQNGGIRRPVIIYYAAPTAHLWHETFEAISFYVSASCLLLLLTGIALTWFLRGSLSPLRELGLRAEGVSTLSWEFEIPHGVLETRELQPIAASLQKLLVGLRESFERQRQFTGDAAHELKTSLAVLKSSLQLLLMRERTPHEYEQRAEDLLVDVQRMEDLTNRMLALARSEQSQLEMDGSSDLAAVLNFVIERTRPAAALRKVAMEAPVGEPTLVSMDPHDAELLCSNLLMNAIQHSPPGSLIDIALHDCSDRVELQISDTGDGISQEALPRIFERFYRADPSRSRVSGGAGLGLAICKAIVDRCRGTIVVSSLLGAGTTVKVCLPRATASKA